MHNLEVGQLGLVTGLGQGLKGRLDQGADAATEDNLFAEQVGLGLFLEGGFQGPGPCAANAVGVGQGRLAGLLRGVLIDGEQHRHSAALFVFAAHQVAGPLGSDHNHVDVLGRHDLPEVDVEAVAEADCLALGEVGRDCFFVDSRLDLVGQENLDDVALLRGFGGTEGLEPVLDGHLVVWRSLEFGDQHLDTGVAQVLGLSVPLAAVADDSHRLTLERRKFRIFLVIDFCHTNSPNRSCCRLLFVRTSPTS